MKNASMLYINIKQPFFTALNNFHRLLKKKTRFE